MKRVVVTGGRDYDDYGKVVSVLSTLDKDCVIVHGGATGADELAFLAAMELDLKVEVHKADWKTYGRTAGPIRNQQMVKDADLVIAFPGGRGTANCVQEARKRDVRVWFVA